MDRSSRKNPCPVCGRNKDDKCRWNDEIILCYYGEDFHPPFRLQKKDKIRIDGKQWFLLKKDAGFSGGSYCFVCDDGRFTKQPLTRTERKKALLKSIRFSMGAEIAFCDLRSIYKKCLSVPPLETMTLQEFNQHEKLVRKSMQKCRGLISFVHKQQQFVERKSFYKTALKVWEKQCYYELKDCLVFRKNNLGQ